MKVKAFSWFLMVLLFFSSTTASVKIWINNVFKWKKASRISHIVKKKETTQVEYMTIVFKKSTWSDRGFPHMAGEKIKQSVTLQ